MLVYEWWLDYVTLCKVILVYVTLLVSNDYGDVLWILLEVGNCYWYLFHMFAFMIFPYKLGYVWLEKGLKERIFV